MGCDIHAVIERRNETYKNREGVQGYEWLNSGDPDIGRHYELFALLAGVRNSDNIKPISEPRGIPGGGFIKRFSDGGCWVSYGNGDYNQRVCGVFETMLTNWDANAHSHSWLTLAELKAFDIDQTVYDASYVQRGKDGSVTMTYRSGSMVTEKTERVGERKLMTWPGEDEPRAWLRLLRYMDQAKWDGQTDDEVRLVFFFDN